MASQYETCDSLLSVNTLSLAATGTTTLYTVPAGKRCILTKAYLVAGGSAGTSTLTIGQVGALTDFLGTQTLSNLTAQNDAVILSPVPSATPPKQKSYNEGTVIQANVTSASGSATNTIYLFGFLINK